MNIPFKPISSVPLSKADFVSKQTVRWCPGCGDYSILANIQKIMPELDIPKENIFKLHDHLTPYDLNRNRFIRIISRWFVNNVRSLINNEVSIRSISSLLSGLTFGEYRRKGRNVLIFSSNLEIRPLLSELNKDKMINLIFWDELIPNNRENIVISYIDIINNIINDGKLREFTTRKGIDIFNLIYPEVKNIIYIHQYKTSRIP